jgi:hypothetical protein
MSKTNDEYTLPTDKDARTQILGRLSEISAQQQMIKDRQENIKEIKALLKEDNQMPASLITKLVKALDDDEYFKMTVENSHFELVRETLMGDGGLPDDNEVDDGVNAGDWPE